MRRCVNVINVHILALALWVGLSCPNVARAQEGNSSTASRADTAKGEVNLEAQLYMIVASNGPGERGNLPPPMEAVARQLKATLPFAGYRVSTSFLNRVRDGGSVEVSGVGGPMLFAQPAGAAANPGVSPTFFSFSLSRVKLITGDDGQPYIRLDKFRLGLRVPVQTATTRVEGSTQGHPVIQYQDTGLTTEVSVREGTPTVVGTLAASRPDELFVVVLTIRRAAAR